MMKISYATKLAGNIKKLEFGKWYSIAGRPDYAEFVQCVKDWIDVGCNFEFNDDYTLFRMYDTNHF